MNTYWEIIENSMKEQGIKSWYKLSKMTGISEGTLSNNRLRNGYLSFENTCKVAKALNIKLEDLNEW